MTVEILAGSDAARLAITCEHASEALPAPWQWPEEDAWLRGSHWAYDIGAAALVRRLAMRLEAPAVLCGFTRLLADPNRPPSSPEIFREHAEGRPVALNAQVDDRERRLGLWNNYHGAVDRMAASCSGSVLFSVHSFTPIYEGQRRDVELGVLYDADEELAKRLAQHLAGFATDVRLNEPYSGKQGLIYAVDRHARAHRRQAVELEVRQDRCADAGYREALSACLAAFAW